MSSALRAAAAATLAAVFGAGCASTPKPSGKRSPLERLTKEARREMIGRAQVWTPTDVSAVDIKAGPQGKGAYAPGETITCDKTEGDSTGRSPKFYCEETKDDELKVKYGVSNGEVYAEVLATRLLWALGFAVDRMYPVRVVCRGCSADPFHDPVPAPSPVTFDPAAIERKLPGKTLESKPDSGWKWPELDLVDESKGGAPLAHRDALKLLAVMIKHTDNKAQQQRLICAEDAADEEKGTCAWPVMMINDLGVTFGKPIITNSNSKGSLNYENWTSSRVWKDPEKCVGNLKKSFTGTLKNPRISEAGRRFLADLLVQLSDQQIHDLFEVARVERRQPKPGQDWPKPHPVSDWVEAFKQKRNEIVHHSCPE
jgi:hypothetical protein